jgi:cellulose synthase/poly-beta-1,6-N-acetylglucosamine synthase-like glycosyltransferase
VLQQAVVWAGAWLLVAAALLVGLGHRVRGGHQLASLALVGTTAAAAWAAQAALLGEGLHPGVAAGITLAAGTVVVVAWRRWTPCGHAAFAAACVSAAVFLAYVVSVVVEAHLGPWSLALALVLLALQLGTLLLLVAHTFEVIDVLCRTQWRRVGGARYVPGFAPKVSLHVPTHNEPPELVIQTLDALARLDYPDYEVLVIDNNTADERLWRPVQAHCARLGPRFRFFHLRPWPGYKSGALNFALSQTAADATIVGVIDADYVVEPGYLKDLVGHFADPRMAFVQTPQDYRDGDSRGRFGRALYLSYLYFFRISMAARNEGNGIIYAGTMGLIRRAALEAVGGWDEWCITEDAEVALRLLDAGYESLYVDRTYGRGLMPLDLAGLKRQRFRWAFGGMQLLRLHWRRLLLPWWPGKLTPAQRWLYLSGGLQWLNDPLAFGFTLLLLVGSGALLISGSLSLQPIVGMTLLMPPLFVLFGVLKFVWAFRVRAGCTSREALDALTVLLGLTWTVSLACVRGLVSRQGEFLRTPKQGERPRLRDVLRVVRWETGVGAICTVAGLALMLPGHPSFASARAVMIVLLGWQAAMYLSALRTGLWSLREARAPGTPVARPTAGLRRVTWGRFAAACRSAAWPAGSAVAAGAVLYLALTPAPVNDGVLGAPPASAPSAAPSPPRDPTSAVVDPTTQRAERGDSLRHGDRHGRVPGDSPLGERDRAAPSLTSGVR